MSDATRTAYLFRGRDQDLFGVTLDETGANLPRTACTQGWLLRKEFQLGIHEPLPAPCDPEPINRSINTKGYYIWRDPCWAQRKTHWLTAITPPPRTSTGTTIEKSRTAQ
jgi:hypothetical protein